MSITWTNVTDVAPELSTVGVAQQNAILAQVNEELNADTWGMRIDRGRAWLAAHLGTIQARRGSAGSLTSEKVGEVSRSFAPRTDATALESTTYGAEFERQLLQLTPARWVVSE